MVLDVKQNTVRDIADGLTVIHKALEEIGL